MVIKMKYLKKLELSDEMFTEKEKKKIEKYYEKGNNYYNSIEKSIYQEEETKILIFLMTFTNFIFII